MDVKGHASMFGANAIWGMMSPIAKFVMISGTITPLVVTNLRIAGAMILFWLVSLFIKPEHVPRRARRARGPRPRPLSGEQGAARHGGHAHVVGRAGVRGVPRLRAGPAPRLRTGGAGRIPRRWRRRAQDDEVSVPAAGRRPAAREA